MSNKKDDKDRKKDDKSDDKKKEGDMKKTKDKDRLEKTLNKRKEETKKWLSYLLITHLITGNEDDEDEDENEQPLLQGTYNDLILEVKTSMAASPIEIRSVEDIENKEALEYMKEQKEAFPKKAEKWDIFIKDGFSKALQDIDTDKLSETIMEKASENIKAGMDLPVNPKTEQIMSPFLELISSNIEPLIENKMQEQAGAAKERIKNIIARLGVSLAYTELDDGVVQKIINVLNEDTLEASIDKKADDKEYRILQDLADKVPNVIENLINELIENEN